MAREQNLARILNKTRDETEDLKTANRDQSKRIDQLEHKLSILQKTSSSPQLTPGQTKYNVLKNEIAKNIDDLLSTSSTPPSSCKELLMLGYFLDGLFLVKNKQSKKLQTVFCQFSANNQGRITIYITDTNPYSLSSFFKSFNI